MSHVATLHHTTRQSLRYTLHYNAGQHYTTLLHPTLHTTPYWCELYYTAVHLYHGVVLSLHCAREGNTLLHEATLHQMKLHHCLATIYYATLHHTGPKLNYTTTILYTMLYYNVLHSIPSHCTTLLSRKLPHTAPYHCIPSTLLYKALHRTTPPKMELIELLYTTLRYTMLREIKLRYTKLHYTTLYSTTHCSVL